MTTYFKCIVSDNFEDVTLATASFQADGSPEDFSHADSFIESELGDATYCDDIPDITEDMSQASEQETVIVTEETTESQDDSMVLSEETDMNESLITFQSNTNISQNSIPKPKPSLPKKPDISVTQSDKPVTVVNGSIPRKGELTVSELYSESDTSEICHIEKRRLPNGSSTSGLKRTDSKSKTSKTNGSLKPCKKELQTDSNQNITFVQHEYGEMGLVEGRQTTGDKQGEVTGSKDNSEGTIELSTGKSKRNKRKQVGDI